MNAKTKAFRARELSSHATDAAGSAPPEAASPEAAYAAPQAPQRCRRRRRRHRRRRRRRRLFGSRLLLQWLFSLRFSAPPLSSRSSMESVRLPSRSCHFLR